MKKSPTGKLQQAMSGAVHAKMTVELWKRYDRRQAGIPQASRPLLQDSKAPIMESPGRH